MFKKRIVLMLAFLFLLTIMPLVSSAPPVTTVQQFQEGYVIRPPQDTVLKVGETHDFDLHVFNISNGKAIISGISCYLHLYGTDGDHLTTLQTSTPVMFDYEFSVMGANFSTAGDYYINYQCNSSTLGGYESNGLLVTPNGNEITTPKSIFYVGLLSILIFFFAITIFSFTQFNNLLNRVAMIGLGYLLSIAITFIGWNMASDFLISSPFLIDMLRILFLVLVIGFFPLVIGGFAWYFIQLFQIKEIQDLMNKGMSEDEAYRRVKRR